LALRRGVREADSHQGGESGAAAGRGAARAGADRGGVSCCSGAAAGAEKRGSTGAAARGTNLCAAARGLPCPRAAAAGTARRHGILAARPPAVTSIAMVRPEERSRDRRFEVVLNWSRELKGK